jgi:hypothetical protein
VLDFLIVAGIIVSGVAFLFVFIFLVAYCNAYIKCLEADEEADRINDEFNL